VLDTGDIVWVLSHGERNAVSWHRFGVLALVCPAL
jgi:hypothetical protein